MPSQPLSDELAFEAVRLVREHGGVTQAALAMGIARTTLQSRYSLGVQRQAKTGVEAPYVIKGTSTYFDGEGVARGQWVKTSLDDQKRKEMLDAAVAALSETLPRVPATQGPVDTTDDLLNVYTLTDCHVGMLAWRKEGGADWDLGIAERTLIDCFAAMVEGAPRAGTAIVSQLGDFLHIDGLSAITPTSGHLLDADGRFGKMVEVAIRVLRRVIDMALARHAKVHVVIAEGNHDLAGSVWLRKMFAALYENEPRLTVDDSELPYYAFQHGETMLGFHHGHLKKNDQLPALFAAQFPRLWGNTVKRYAHCGHRHHTEERDHGGMTVVQHATLAARDAYAARGGWISERQAQAITYHSRFGKVGTNIVCPEMLAA